MSVLDRYVEEAISDVMSCLRDALNEDGQPIVESGGRVEHGWMIFEVNHENREHREAFSTSASVEFPFDATREAQMDCARYMLTLLGHRVKSDLILSEVAGHIYELGTKIDFRDHDGCPCPKFAITQKINKDGSGATRCALCGKVTKENNLIPF